MKLDYDNWYFQVHKRLVHSDAIKLVAVYPKTLQMWHEFGFSPARIAERLNERWQVKQATATAEDRAPS